MNFTKNQLIIAGITSFVVTLGILVLVGVIPGLQSSDPTDVAATLAIWNVEDSEGAFAAAFTAFRTKYRNVTFQYRSFPDEATYEAALIDALAAGEGPDIFAVRSDKVLRHANKMLPALTAITLPELRARFPQIVEKDFYRAGSGTYALPLSIDTLTLFYHRDLLDTAGVAKVPATWDDIQRTAPLLTKKDSTGAVLQSGVALGGRAEEIEAAIDTLYLLMLQTGTKMGDERGDRAAFDSAEGLNALRFYLQFGNPTSASYAWRGNQGSARVRFADEKLAMMIDYASAIPALAARNTFLNYGVAPVPQPKDAGNALTYASYYGLGVSRRSANPALAWEFITTAATSEAAAQSYAEATKKPPALRSLANAYESDPVRRVFARQILTARSWLQTDPDAIRASFSKLIESAIMNPSGVANALRTAEREVTEIISRGKF
ncbi:MAG: extracellular solute-binding protein [Candidatus Brennerbacteria bacterium]|nr:extracellular solute-binding protein [Candidatus Brennerbacteria bacterium]